MDVIDTAKMRRAVLGLALGLTLAGGSWGACAAQAVAPVAAAGGTGKVPSGTRIFPLSEVHKGLKGVAYTVFEGVNPGAMDLV